ncbi:MAG: GNAT family N-acetyltransferase [Candidatus Zixiibacteriota bacterium]
MSLNEFTRVKADLVPFTAEYSRDVLSWIDSERTYRNLCRATEFPPRDDLVDSWQREGVSSYLLFSEGKPVAYGELWEKPLEKAIEIAHLIVDPYQRSRGFGTMMLKLLYERAARRPNVVKVILNLFNGDEIALGCYVKAGFELVGITNYATGLRMERMVK